jgi:hypothetical protein
MVGSGSISAWQRMQRGNFERRLGSATAKLGAVG